MWRSKSMALIPLRLSSLLHFQCVAHRAEAPPQEQWRPGVAECKLLETLTVAKCLWQRWQQWHLRLLNPLCAAYKGRGEKESSGVTKQKGHKRRGWISWRITQIQTSGTENQGREVPGRLMVQRWKAWGKWEDREGGKERGRERGTQLGSSGAWGTQTNRVSKMQWFS